ncbi:helix-turn-helix domain-containing protein [Ottowia thiooxydans]|uniref:AraC family transcriptional activator of tynA and feaB n=1 Tax=Ottowia thiooxydans TaxID=219182 RepID=A0ABV2Q5C8_9BURK
MPSTRHREPQFPPLGGGLGLITTFSTDDVPPWHRRDYWMAHAYRAVEAHMDRDADIRGQVSVGGHIDSGQIVLCESSAVSTRMTAQRLRAQLSDEHIAICLMLKGSFDVQEPDGTQARMAAGDLFMFDCGRPMAARWSDSVTSYLRLPRSMVRQRLGRDPSAFSGVLSRLSSNALAPFLAAQMRVFATHGAALSASALPTALQAAVELSLRLLSDHFGVGQDGITSRDDKRRAVYQYMRQHAHSPELTAETIAQALNCSRTQLYRLFEDEPLSVKAALREMRLQKSREMLSRAGSGINVGAVANACGFSDPSVFGKLFRQRFGGTPRDAANGRLILSSDPAFPLYPAET